MPQWPQHLQPWVPGPRPAQLVHVQKRSDASRAHSGGDALFGGHFECADDAEFDEFQDTLAKDLEHTRGQDAILSNVSSVLDRSR